MKQISSRSSDLNDRAAAFRGLVEEMAATAAATGPKGVVRTLQVVLWFGPYIKMIEFSGNAAPA